MLLGCIPRSIARMIVTELINIRKLSAHTEKAESYSLFNVSYM